MITRQKIIDISKIILIPSMKELNIPVGNVITRQNIQVIFKTILSGSMKVSDIHVNNVVMRQQQKEFLEGISGLSMKVMSCPNSFQSMDVSKRFQGQPL